MMDFHIGYMDQRYLLAVVNWFLCFGICCICVCRFKLMSVKTRKTFRAKYALLFTAGFYSSMSPILTNDWPGIPAIVITTSFLFHLYSGRYAWKHKAPDYTYTDQAPLDGEKPCGTLAK